MSFIIKIVLLILISSLDMLYAVSGGLNNHANNTCTLLNSNHKIQSIDHSIKQIVIVEYLSGINAKISACQKINNHWQSAWDEKFNAVVGKNGLASKGTKQEGDLKTPEGLYPIGELFGYNTFKTNMKYQKITKQDKFIDDPKSPQYNSWVRGSTDATSYENMLVANNTYQIGAVINYNMAPVTPGAGSAIFLHIWKSPTHATIGCVAMSKPNLYKLLTWFNYLDKPYILIIKSNDLKNDQ